MCAQVGTLEPHAYGLDDLRAILVIQHPHEPTKYEQGSYLSEKDVVALASMEQTTELKDVKFKIEHRLAEVCVCSSSGFELQASQPLFSASPQTTRRAWQAGRHCSLELRVVGACMIA